MQGVKSFGADLSFSRPVSWSGSRNNSRKKAQEYEFPLALILLAKLDTRGLAGILSRSACGVFLERTEACACCSEW